MYTIKELPEDFVVSEILKPHFPLSQEKNKYIIIKVSKRELTTNQAVEILAQFLSINNRSIGFCGLKDKQAITHQYFSLQLTDFDVTKFSKPIHAQMTVTFVGYSPQPLFIGNLAGNRFELVIKNAGEYTINSLTSFVNYFGEQRFSSANVLIGKLLLQKKYDVALKTILEHTHQKQTVNKLQAHLAIKPNDAIGGLRRIPDNILSLYLHAYQSYLWNKAASLLCGDGVIDEELSVVIPRSIPSTTKIPLVGFEYEPTKYDKLISDTLNAVLLEDGLTNRDFIIRAIPSITQMGGTRDLVAPIHDLVFSDEGLIKKIGFSLDSGCYATVALRHLLVLAKK